MKMVWCRSSTFGTVIKNKKILITGGAGFIGSHVVRLFITKYPEYKIYNLDALTYAGNLENLTAIENEPNYTFVKADICDREKVKEVFEQYDIDGVIHLAAESHVDRSITNPFEFAQTNIMGTLTLLNQAKISWKDNYADNLFYHISTDEVYGSLGKEGFFLEDKPYDPKSPYSAAKALLIKSELPNSCALNIEIPPPLPLKLEK